MRMSLTLAELTDLLSTILTAQPWADRAIRTQKVRNDEYLLIDLFDQLAAAPSQPMPPTLEKVPWADVRASHESQRQLLGAVEVAFVQLVAAKAPAQVSIDEARRLAKLAADAPLGSMDGALLETAFRPIREHHESHVEAANRSLLASVKRVAVPALPARASQLLETAVAAENPTLRPHEAAQRSRELIAEINARRTGQTASDPSTAPSVADRAMARHNGLTGAAPVRY